MSSCLGDILPKEMPRYLLDIFIEAEEKYKEHCDELERKMFK